MYSRMYCVHMVQCICSFAKWRGSFLCQMGRQGYYFLTHLLKLWQPMLSLSHQLINIKKALLAYSIGKLSVHCSKNTTHLRLTEITKN